MAPIALPAYVNDIAETVRSALREDVGAMDWTAQLSPDIPAQARVITREVAVVCGRPWVDAVFHTLSPSIRIDWQVAEGQHVAANTVLFTLQGPARALLTGERSALNFLQLLSGTATTVAQYVAAVAGTACAIADTRKTIPGLRNAQKYAVLCGGGVNHRIGLYDGILIKENHIAAAGNIRAALASARALQSGVPLMTEAENLDEVRAALAEDVDLLLIDELPDQEIREAVSLTRAQRDAGGHTVLEYSGGVTLESVRHIAELGVDRVSVGGLTKHVRAIDLSMRFTG
jgi:nicotinate-nucleotide pyrophosphorylase (carboxylating)